MEKQKLSEIVVQFSQTIIRICHELDYQKYQVLSRQLLRSATAIGAAYAEARDAESADDFIHKMKVAKKEASETQYWFDVLNDKPCITQESREQLISIQKILARSLDTALKNKKNKSNEITNK